MNTSYIAYGFQVAEDVLIVLNDKVMIPFDDSFPDDWCFDEWQVDQVTIGGVLWWTVKEKGVK